MQRWNYIMKSGSAVSRLCILYECTESMLYVSWVPKQKMSLWVLSTLKHQTGCAKMVQKDKVGKKNIMLNAFGQDRYFRAIWSDADIIKWWAEQAEAAFCWGEKKGWRVSPKVQIKDRGEGLLKTERATLLI